MEVLCCDSSCSCSLRPRTQDSARNRRPKERRQRLGTMLHAAGFLRLCLHYPCCWCGRTGAGFSWLHLVLQPHRLAPLPVAAGVHGAAGGGALRPSTHTQPLHTSGATAARGEAMPRAFAPRCTVCFLARPQQWYGSGSSWLEPCLRLLMMQRAGCEGRQGGCAQTRHAHEPTHQVFTIVHCCWCSGSMEYRK